MAGLAGFRVLALEEDLGRRLVTTLDASQRRSAIFLPEAPADILTTNQRHVTRDTPVGIAATGMTEADMDKPQVGISSVWYEGNPCNMHLLDLAQAVKEGVVAAGMVGMRFNTIGVSDGISMGTDGMSYSLQSRDIIADSIETVMGAQWYDGLITLPGCDKNMPGCIMALARLDRPALQKLAQAGGGQYFELDRDGDRRAGALQFQVVAVGRGTMVVARGLEHAGRLRVASRARQSQLPSRGVGTGSRHHSRRVRDDRHGVLRGHSRNGDGRVTRHHTCSRTGDDDDSITTNSAHVRSARAGAPARRFSMMVTFAIPPPSHMVCRP